MKYLKNIKTFLSKHFGSNLYEVDPKDILYKKISEFDIEKYEADNKNENFSNREILDIKNLAWRNHIVTPGFRIIKKEEIKDDDFSAFSFYRFQRGREGNIGNQMYFIIKKYEDEYSKISI